MYGFRGIITRTWRDRDEARRQRRLHLFTEINKECGTYWDSGTSESVNLRFANLEINYPVQLTSAGALVQINLCRLGK